MPRRERLAKPKCDATRIYRGALQQKDEVNKAQTAYQTALQTGAKIMGQSLLDYVK